MDTDQNAAVHQLPIERPPDPMLILSQIAAKGGSTEQLKVVADLVVLFQNRAAAQAFNTAMNQVQGKMPIVVRDARNTQTNSGYAKFENVQEICRPVYTGAGFSVSFGEQDCAVADFKRIEATVRHKEGHVERYHIDLPKDGIGPKGNPIAGMNAVQGCISTMSYGSRVLLCRIFNITIADTDNDGSAANGQEVTPAMLGEFDGLLAALKTSGVVADWAKFTGQFWTWLSTVAKTKIEKPEDCNYAVWLLATQDLKRRLPKNKEPAK